MKSCITRILGPLVIGLFIAVPCTAGGLDLIKKGQEAEQAGRHKEALEAYSQAIGAGNLTNAQLAFAYSRRGSMKGFFGDNASAIEDFSQSIALNGNSGSSYSLRGYLRGMSGQYDLAERDHVAAIGLAKSSTWEHYLAWALQHYADLWRRRGDFDKALAYCAKAQKTGTYATLHFRRAWIYLDMGRNAEAKSEFAKFEQEMKAQGVSYNVFWPDERAAITRLAGLSLGGDRKLAAEHKIEAFGSLRHPSVVQAIAITPDSQKAFIAVNDGSVLAYSLETRKPIGAAFQSHNMILGLALNARGDRLATAEAGGLVKLLDAATLKMVKVVSLPGCERLVFSADSEALFVAVSTGHLVKLNASDLKTAKDIVPTTGSRVLALACARDGRVATSDKDGKIKLWSGSGLDPLGEWKAHEVYARSLAFDPSGQHLVSGGTDGALKAWRLSDRSLIKETKDLHQLAIEAIAFAPDGRFVTGGYDGLCQFWDGKKFDGTKSYPNYRGYYTACAISADGRWLVRGGSSLDFAPMDDPEEFERVVEFGGAIMGLAVAPGRKRFTTGGLDRRLIFWEIDKGITSKEVVLGDWVTAVEFCNEGGTIAAGLMDGRIALYSAPAMQPMKSWPAHDGRVSALANVAGKLVSLGDDGVVRLWDLQGTRLRSHDEQSPCRSIAVHGTRFAVGTAEGTISIYDATKDDPVKRLKGRPLSVTALGFTRDGTRLLAGYFDGALEAFDTMAWTVAKFHSGKGDRVLSIEANPSQDLVAVGYGDGYARVYDAASLRETASIQPTPVREIFAARWVLDDNTFALAGASNGISFWKLKSQNVSQDGRVLDVGAAGVKVDGEITKGIQSISYHVRLSQGKTYVIDMIAPAGSPLDAYLRLMDPSGREVAKDDDGGGGHNARITYVANVAGTYQVVATSYGGSVGPFTLMVKEKQ